MMAHGYAPSVNPPPILYARFTRVRELGLRWEDTGLPLSSDEVNLLVELVNVARMAGGQRARLQGMLAKTGGMSA